MRATAQWSGLPAEDPDDPEGPRDGTGEPADGTAGPADGTGTPADGAGPDGTTSSPPRRARGVLAEIVLLLALVLALPPLLMGGAPAETTARHALQALVDGDVAALQEHLAPAGDALDIALAPEVIGATEARIERFTLTAVRTDQDRAEVDARLRVGGRVVATTLHLTRHRDGAWPRRAWALEPIALPTVQVAIPVGTAQLRLNGRVVTVPEARRPRGAEGLGVITLRVLPGLYEIEAVDRGALVDPIPVRVNVPPLLSPWTSVPLRAGYALTDTGRLDLAAQLRDSLETCLASTSSRPVGCPFAAPGARKEQGSWRLVTDPDVRVSGGWTGTFTVDALGGVAEFTVPVGAERETPRHDRVPFDARAVGVLDRDGALVTSWDG